MTNKLSGHVLIKSRAKRYGERDWNNRDISQEKIGAPIKAKTTIKYQDMIYLAN